MTLIVRDEADLVAENIKFHARMGVDAFAIYDNGSKDETLELLQGLRTTYDLALFDDPGPFDKERRSMVLARHLRERQGADWLISNDADEFWLPKSGNLKSLMGSETSVLVARRYNFLPRTIDVAACDYKFHHNIMLVEKPYGPQPPAPDPSDPLLYPIMLRAIPGKVACALEGLEHIHKGNHSVDHAKGPALGTDDAIVFHYHIRSYEYFESKIRNHGENLDGVTGGTSWHLRRWHAIYLAGNLRKEYESLLLDEQQTQSLLADGVIREERVLANFFAAAEPSA
ncbi:glycosyltransferase family 2 protein [Methylocapsa sp. S129]|uniref:glycosyltransferase family 2 protein n=1 Tax=Methylocapsa sp. S129 TaxID=1641869 RepID=UPI00131AF15F|nr:glycosyltransferase family 2 protein [Methylocapsa sp. S129]